MHLCWPPRIPRPAQNGFLHRLGEMGTHRAHTGGPQGLQANKGGNLQDVNDDESPVPSTQTATLGEMVQSHHILNLQGRHTGPAATHLQSTADHAVDCIVATSAHANDLDTSISPCKTESYVSI